MFLQDHAAAFIFSLIDRKFPLDARCKESQFYSLPFGQAVDSMYYPKSQVLMLTSPMMSRFDNSSFVIRIALTFHLAGRRVKNRIH